jgi:5-methylcytosine-specific restriction endonuclease McrA
MSSVVYVINHNGHPLMPCTPAKARKLLRDSRAEVIGRCPFTIKLLWECEEQVQEVSLGIDKGSHYTGFCCVGNGNLLLSGEIQHRQDVKDKMENRRTNRRNRRSRKWYRPKRSLNRASSKRSGRLPPSIKTNVEEVIRVVEHIPLPISRTVIEDVQVDIARLNDPTLRGSRYQDPTRLDENLRIACLMRDGYQCQQCGKVKCRLEVHHLIYREHGGKDTLPNLLTLCESCHHKVHQGAITLKVTGVGGQLDQIAQRTMQGKSYLYATSVCRSPLPRSLATRQRPCVKREACQKRMTSMPCVSPPTRLARWCPMIVSTSIGSPFVLVEPGGSVMICHAKARVEYVIR